ncbi:hypothetical protein DPMN_158976 [Dreissena polymorpha]|uniref:Uncharacterized protein n=1 Tax=Dreissena polymorpha TaxID=45954 RepID=A0A9D4EME6_DREPO|nr:hypothetical protein DPMN_158976 [Dreissena polymorpha]
MLEKCECYSVYGRRTKTNPKTSPEQSGALKTIFQLVREINKTNVLTKFHNDKAKNVTSKVFDHKFHDDWANSVSSRFSRLHYIHIEKNAPPTGGHVFLPIWTIFKPV